MNDNDMLIRFTDGKPTIISKEYLTKKYVTISCFQSTKSIALDILSDRSIMENIDYILKDPNNKQFKQYVITKYRLYDNASVIAKMTENYSMDKCYDEIISHIIDCTKCSYK